MVLLFERQQINLSRGYTYATINPFQVILLTNGLPSMVGILPILPTHPSVNLSFNREAPPAAFEFHMKPPMNRPLCPFKVYC